MTYKSAVEVVKSSDEYNRMFDAARKAQGFKSQKHLDAFFTYYDHTKNCAECQKPGKPAYFDDGYQPTRNTCPVGIELRHDSDAYL